MKRYFLHLFLVLLSPEMYGADIEGNEGPKIPNDWCFRGQVCAQHTAGGQVLPPSIVYTGTLTPRRDLIGKLTGGVGSRPGQTGLPTLVALLGRVEMRGDLVLGHLNPQGSIPVSKA